MSLLCGTRRALLGGREAPYWQQIINDYAPDRYWPLFDAIGTANAIELIAGDDAPYNGPTLANAANPNGFLVPRFDGVNDKVNIAALGATFPGIFDGNVFSSIIACRVFNLAVWADAARRSPYAHGVDANNVVRNRKEIAANQFLWIYTAGGVTINQNRIGENTVNWFTIGMTSNRTANRVRFYWNGIQEGINQAHPAAWVGVPVNANTVIGDRFGLANSWPWNGWLSDHLYWAGRELAPAEFAGVDAILRAL